MTSIADHPVDHRIVHNALAHYYPEVQRALAFLDDTRGDDTRGDDTPAFRLPELSEPLVRFFAASDVGVVDLPGYRGRTLRLLDLTRNPRTRTTKTLASLVIVARAVRHIRETGERIMIVTPSSANKATALRDAVERALDVGLAGPDELRITSVVPTTSAGKLWASRLGTDPLLNTLNPMVLHDSAEPAGVKELASSFVAEHAPRFLAQHGIRLWYTLDLNNYLAADVVRAFVERDLLPTGVPARTHAHAVSSAFGLLGHHLGHRIADDANLPTARYFLVQHLGAPDMVLSLCHGSPDPRHRPRYRRDPDDGLYRQSEDPHFPFTTFEPEERLDPTFYTRRPATSARIDPVIAQQGGGGLVVSLFECLHRYAQVREILSAANVRLPADPRELREWSLVMAVTGVLNGIDRDLIPEREDVLVHGSGTYSENDYVPLPPSCRRSAADVRKLAEVVDAACRHAVPVAEPQ